MTSKADELSASSEERIIAFLGQRSSISDLGGFRKEILVEWREAQLEDSWETDELVRSILSEGKYASLEARMLEVFAAWS